MDQYDRPFEEDAMFLEIFLPLLAAAAIFLGLIKLTS